MIRDSSDGDPPAVQVNEESKMVRHQSSPGQHFDREEIRASENVPCRRMNSFQVVVLLLSGTGSMPCQRRVLPTVWSDTRYPRLAKAPTIQS
jgi:hypothetical protein